MVVGLGALGVVTRVTLDVEPAYEVRQRVFEGLPWDALFEHFDAIIAARLQRQRLHALGRARSTRCGSRAASTDAPEDVRSDLFGARRGDRRAAPDPRHRPGQLHGAARPARPVVGPPAALPHGLHAERRRGAAVRVPASRASTPCAAIEARARAGRRDPRPCSRSREIRTIAADGLWMSPQYGRDTVGIHFTWERDADGRRARARATSRRRSRRSTRARTGASCSWPAPTRSCRATSAARLRRARRAARSARRVPQRAGSSARSSRRRRLHPLCPR